MSQRTEAKIEFLGTAALNPLVTHVSSPRAVMDGNHTAQHLPLISPEEPIVKAGIEYEMGHYINDARTEHDCVVKAIIPKYSNGELNTETVLLVEYERNGKNWLDFIHIQEYMSTHNMFGYKLTPTDAFRELTYNSAIPKDTILGAAASYGKDGTYDFSINANVAFMSHPSVAEDGFAISTALLDKMKYTMVTKRVINLTKNLIPININGDSNFFKFLPDIGEAVRPDGLLCAYRESNEWFSPVDMSDEGLCELDSTFDTPVYVPPGSFVTDINIVRGNYTKPELSPAITRQLDYYAEVQTNYYKEIVDRYNKVLAEKASLYGHDNAINETPRLRRFIADCMVKVNAAANPKYKLFHRKLPIDQYRIEVTVCSVRRPNLGNKFTDFSAAKGVCCAILPPEAMPVDSNGVRADIITDSSSTISRMNLSRAYTAYLGAMARDNQMRLQQHLINKHGPNYLSLITEEDVKYCIEYLKGIYTEINSDMMEFVNSLNVEEQYHHVIECLTRNIFIYLPTDNEKNVVDIIDSLEKTVYKPHIGKVSYIDDYGNTVTTEEDIRIGNMPFMLLDKVAMDGAAVSSARTNSFNFPIKGSNADKYKYPHSLTPTTTLSETEVRILSSFADPEMIAELLDLAMNPVSHKQLVKNIYNSDKAYDPNLELCRETFSYGNTKSLSLLRHVFNAAGFDIKYTEPDYLKHE